jgi:hypothetical protein
MPKPAQVASMASDLFLLHAINVLPRAAKLVLSMRQALKLAASVSQASFTILFRKLVCPAPPIWERIAWPARLHLPQLVPLELLPLLPRALLLREQQAPHQRDLK